MTSSPALPVGKSLIKRIPNFLDSSTVRTNSTPPVEQQENYDAARLKAELASEAEYSTGADTNERVINRSTGSPTNVH